jgi:hypothetical protein
MIQILPKIIEQFDMLLLQKYSEKAPSRLSKMVRYYLDFCFKYHYDKSKKESLSYFIKKLKDENRTERQQKQAFHVVSIFYGIKNTDQDEIEALSENTF